MAASRRRSSSSRDSVDSCAAACSAAPRTPSEEGTRASACATASAAGEGGPSAPPAPAAAPCCCGCCCCCSGSPSRGKVVGRPVSSASALRKSVTLIHRASLKASSTSAAVRWRQAGGSSSVVFTTPGMSGMGVSCSRSSLRKTLRKLGGELGAAGAAGAALAGALGGAGAAGALAAALAAAAAAGKERARLGALKQARRVRVSKWLEAGISRHNNGRSAVLG